MENVVSGSIAEELGLGTGDCIVYINGEEVGDILDWRLAEGCEDIVLTVAHKDGFVEYEIEKDYDESLGIIFESPTIDDVRSCRNRCLFCFVDQQPKGMRPTLYVKDDDYRLSFISGSYITLTNLNDADIDRIIRLHLSPLYVSVHATEPGLRSLLLNNRRAGLLMDVLKQLSAAGTSFHTQVVLCPGLNDGAHLERTISDLYSLAESVLSLAVVPVGLTGHRDGLYNLIPCDRSHAQEVLDCLENWQQQSMRERGRRFVFASDEFYAAANAAIPPHSFYEDYPQLENGVGLVRLLYNDWDAWEDRLPAKLAVKKSATVVTGASAGRYLEPVVRRLNRIHGLSVRLIIADNSYFGGRVTVAGLLTGRDILHCLKESGLCGTVYLPRVMLRAGKNMFLDGYTVDELSAKLGAEIMFVASLDEFLADLFQLKRGDSFD